MQPFKCIRCTAQMLQTLLESLHLEANTTLGIAKAIEEVLLLVERLIIDLPTGLLAPCLGNLLDIFSPPFAGIARRRRISIGISVNGGLDLRRKLSQIFIASLGMINGSHARRKIR